VAEGPQWVRSIGEVEALGIGRGVRALYGRWFDFQQERRRRREDAPAREAFRAAPPSLTEVQQQLVEDLVGRGIAHTSLTSLMGDAWWDRLRADVGRWIASDEVQAAERAYQMTETRKWKDYLVRMYGRGAEIGIDSPWIQFVMQPALLDVVNTYLGMLSKVLYVDVWDTVPLVHDGPDTGSQRWHRDPEDAKLVKVFLYFTDVDAATGAMQYVPNSRNGERYGSLWPQQFPRGSVPPLEDFERAIPAADWHTCAYPAGTLLFVDTSGFHRGGRATADRRVLATWTFTRPSSVFPRSFTVNPTPGGGPRSEAARFAVLE